MWNNDTPRPEYYYQLLHPYLGFKHVAVYNTVYSRLPYNWSPELIPKQLIPTSDPQQQQVIPIRYPKENRV